MCTSTQVAVRRADGSVGYEPVYAFGHADTTTRAEFIELQLKALNSDAETAMQVSKAAEAAPHACCLLTSPSFLPKAVAVR